MVTRAHATYKLEVSHFIVPQKVLYNVYVTRGMGYEAFSCFGKQVCS